MQISNGGKVVLIDDTADEALPLMTAFGKNAIPYLYFDGKPENLPQSPMEGVRFVFLDIELQGMQGQSDKTKASALVGRLKKIISVTNGPFVIIFWTKHSEVIDKIIENCNVASITPKAWVDLDKISCKESDGSIKIEKLSKKIKEKLKHLGAFKLYVEWENVVHSATNKFVTQFSDHIPADEDWCKGTSSLFHKLYTSLTDEQRTRDQLLQFKSACFLLNRSFLDTLQGLTSKDLRLPDDFRLEKGNITSATLAKLNTSLFLIDAILDKPATGYVYIEKDAAIKSLLVDNSFKKGKTPAESELCTIIVTPECDIANEKTLQFFTKDDPPVCHCVHRVVYGIIYPMSCNTFAEEKKLLENKGETSRFQIGPFWFRDKKFIIVINFASLSFKSESKIKSKPIFGLRRDLMFDLQSKAANHVNRLGNFQLN